MNLRSGCLSTLFSLPRPPCSPSCSCPSPPVNLGLSLKNQAQCLLPSDALLRPAGRIAGSLRCVPRAPWRPQGCDTQHSVFRCWVSSFGIHRHLGLPLFLNCHWLQGTPQILLFQPSFFQYQAQRTFGKCLLNK